MPAVLKERQAFLMLLFKSVITLLLAALSGAAMAADSFAFYYAQSVAISNAFNISPVLYISLDPGSGSGSTTELSLVLNDETVLPDNNFSKTGYHFKGWSLASDGLVLSDASALLTESGMQTSLTLYAQWAPNSYTVSFQDNTVNGTLPESLSCTYDTVAALPAYNAAADDMLFIGWSTSADGTDTIISPTASLYNLSDEDGSSVTLYAQWEDESAGLIETNWNKHLDKDSNNNGTPDRLELKSNASIIKDPSVKNLTEEDCYAYISVSVPAVLATLLGESSAAVHDIAVLNITPHWQLVSSRISTAAADSSLYIYRYDTVLKAHGSTSLSSNHPLRHADRSTDLMSSFCIQDFAACPATAASIDVEALLVEAIITENEADELAVLKLTGS